MTNKKYNKIENMKQILSLIALSSAFVIACTGTMSCSNKANTPAESAPVTPKEKEDTTETAEQTEDVFSNKDQISLNGTITTSPQNNVTITPTMGGSIQNIYVFTGDYVRKGQTIVTLKNPEFISLQQEYLTASAQVEYLEKEYLRQKTLASHEAASQKKLQQCKAEYLSQRSTLEGAKAQLKLLNISTARLRRNGISPYLSIAASASGYITNMNINKGQYLNAGETICNIINKAETMILLTAYEKELPYIKKGDKIEFSVNGIPGRTFPAEIYAIDQMVDQKKGSINVYAKAKESDKLFRQGMYVNAIIKKNSNFAGHTTDKK